MILHDPRGRFPSARVGARAPLDALLHRAALRRPDAVALLDPPDRESFTEGAPRRLTYAQADRMVSAIAGRLRRLGLATDAVVGLQIANTVESVLTLLGVLRAGLIATPLPLLWRRAEAVAALGRIGPHALIVSGRIGTTDHYDLAMQVAADIFPVRYVCGYGSHACDGLISFDDLFTADALDPLPPLVEERAGDQGPGAHLAVITWDTTADGLVPVARSHSELIAGALPVVLESRLAEDSVLLSTLTMSSFAGLAVALTPWLLLGGTLALHQPFDADVLQAQVESVGFDAIVVPGPLAAELADITQLAARDQTRMIGVWRAPERLTRASPWRDAKVRMIDVQVFGEAGLIAARRAAGERPAATPLGPVSAARDHNGPAVAAEIATTPHGTLALRGPMVPRAPFPPGAERSGLPYFNVAANGFVDTGYPCRSDGKTMAVTGPPAGIVGIGGYRFLLRELQSLVASVGEATLAVLPDALTGQRLAAAASDRAAIQAALERLGANPLLVGAFGGRSTDDRRQIA